jgi:hypothetical protein
MSNIRAALQQVVQVVRMRAKGIISGTVQGDSDTGLLSCDAVLLEVQFPTFREIARVKQTRNLEY